MAIRTYPSVMQKGGVEVTARNSAQFWNLYWVGYRPTTDPVPVDEDGTFTDAAVAALIRNLDSETYAALVDRVVTKIELRLSQTPPANPAAGTVWIDTSP